MAYTTEQIQQAIQASLGQGFSPTDIINGAYQKYGVSPDQMIGAIQGYSPQAYGTPESYGAMADAVRGVNVTGSGDTGIFLSPEERARINADSAITGQRVFGDAYSPTPTTIPTHAQNGVLFGSRDVNAPNSYPSAGNYAGSGLGGTPTSGGGMGGAPAPAGGSPYASQTLPPAASYGGNDVFSGGQPAQSPAPWQAGGYGSSFSSSTPMLQQYQKSPFLDDMAAGLRTESNNNLQRNLLPGIRSGAAAAGQYGGSRHSIAEGIAMGDTMAGQDRAIAGLYGQDFNNQMGRNLTKYQADQGYSLGQGNQALTNQGQQLSFYGQQRGQDMDQARLGADLYNLGTTGQWGPINQSNGVLNNFTGFGNSTNTSNSGGGTAGLLGGALSGATLGRTMNWW
jgi:hypothetical protein